MKHQVTIEGTNYLTVNVISSSWNNSRRNKTKEREEKSRDKKTNKRERERERELKKREKETIGRQKDTTRSSYEKAKVLLLLLLLDVRLLSDPSFSILPCFSVHFRVLCRVVLVFPGYDIQQAKSKKAKSSQKRWRGLSSLKINSELSCWLKMIETWSRLDRDLINSVTSSS